MARARPGTGQQAWTKQSRGLRLRGLEAAGAEAGPALGPQGDLALRLRGGEQTHGSHPP